MFNLFSESFFVYLNNLLPAVCGDRCAAGLAAPLERDPVRLRRAGVN